MNFLKITLGYLIYWCIMECVCHCEMYHRNENGLICNLPSYFSAPCLPKEKIAAELEIRNRGVDVPMYIQCDDNLQRLKIK